MLEVIFLAGVAAAVTVADLRTAAVIALMVVALVLVWLFEWIAWLDQPHYGRGLPPRYYVPHVALPPPRPVEQRHLEQRRPEGFPVLHPDDAPTFVASTQEWAALDDWPIVADDAEDTGLAVPEAAAPVVPLPPPMHELEQTVAASFVLEELEDAFDEVDEKDEDDEPEEVVPVAAPVAAVVASVAPRPVEHEAPAEVPPLAFVQRPETTAAHHVDPLASGGRRRFRRRRSSDENVVEVLDGPPPDRGLPLRLREESEVRVR